MTGHTADIEAGVRDLLGRKFDYGDPIQVVDYVTGADHFLRHLLEDNARLTAALAAAEVERDRLQATNDTDWVAVEERANRNEALVATGRAVARRYRDGWRPWKCEPLEWTRGANGVEHMTPAEAAYLAELDSDG